jgi:3-(3-hydroxy-phenyl)propionate hydroxylase
VLQWEQYKIAETILARLASDSGADIRMGARVTGVAQDGNGITATVRGPDGVQPIRGRFLVGCDGGRSTVRKLAGIAFDGFTWPERFIKIDTRHDFTALGPKIDNRNYFSDPDEWMNLFKARGEDGSGMWRAVSPTLPDQSDEEILSADAIEARLQRFCPSPTRYELATVALYRVHQRVAHTFNKGRILLAGDAAHVNNPVGGMGMNGGIHDAINLAGAMHKVWFEGGDPDALFDRYTRQRRKGQVDGVQLQSIRNKEMLAEKDPKRRAQRLAAIRRAAEKPDEHDAFIRRACMIDSLRQANAIA